jgi:hypothetical protein
MSQGGPAEQIDPTSGCPGALTGSRQRWPATVATALAVAGLAFRFAMTLAGSPRTNSDESTTGLMGLHIAAGTDFPPFFYGQHYMGALEAYLQAPLFVAFGATVAVQRLAPLAFWAIFVAAMYALTRRVSGSPWFAVAIVGLLALASDRVLKDDMIAGGGYPEINALGAVMLLGVANIVMGEARRVIVTWAVVGAAAGLLLWSDLLIAPYLVVAALLLVVFRRRELAGRAAIALFIGFVMGAAPMLWHDVTHAWAQNSIVSVLRTTDADNGFPDGSLDRLRGGLLIGVPLAGGLCRPGACGPAQQAFGAGYPVLLGLAGGLAAAGWVVARRRRKTPLATAAPLDPAAMARPAIRLALIVAATLTIAAYLRSPASAQTPTESARYLSPLFLALPAVLWPLWQAVTEAPSRYRRAGLVAAVAAVTVLTGLFGLRVYGTATAIANIPGNRQFRADQEALIAALDRRQLTAIYSEYWTCNRIAFATRERVTCAVVNDSLGEGLNRYQPYWALVRNAPRTAYVLPIGGPPDLVLAARGAVPTETVAGYHIYDSRQIVALSPPSAPRTGA